MKPRVLSAFVLAALIVSGPLAGTTIYVDDDNVSGPWDGSPTNPYQYIQDGIDAAASGVDNVLVLDGTYTGTRNKDLDYGGKAITVESENGPATTIIDCEGSGRGFYFGSGEGATSVLVGFTITNGSAGTGGGIHCDLNSSPTITNCTISGNTAEWGGGIMCGTDLSGYGDSYPTMTNCTISGNTAGWGGGIFCRRGGPTSTNCTIGGNTASAGGGAWLEGNSPTITNCTISGNTAGAGGGVACRGIPTITNCTISGNTAAGEGGGICSIYSNPTMTNCILWNDLPEEISVPYSSPLVTYSDVENGTGQPWFGTGCIDKDPLFVSGPLHDYYLSHVAAGQGADSPCVDAGSDTAVNLGLDELTTRTDGAPDSGVVDMGYHAPLPRPLSVTIARLEDDSIQLEWDSETGETYDVFLGHLLMVPHVEPFWFLAATVPGTGSAMTWNDAGGAEWWWLHPADPSLKQRFYQVVERDSLGSPVLEPGPGREEAESANAVSDTTSFSDSASRAGNVRDGSGNVRRK